MTDKLKKQIDALEKGRNDLFDDLKKYDDETINKKPAPGVWSVAQTVEHLILAEEASFKYLQKKTQNTTDLKFTGFKSQWRYILVNTVFVMNLKFKSPTFIVPSENFSTAKDLEARWSKIRNDTFQLLGKLSDADLKKEIWSHPNAGKMNAYQMLAFFGLHFNRHRKQVYRTLAALVL